MKIKLVNKSTDQIIAEDLRLAHTFWSRFKGLMLTKHMPKNSALHIAPCSSIHTFFMKFSIDVLYLDKQHVVVGMEEKLSPGKIGKRFQGAASVVEFPVGRVGELDVRVGQQLEFVGIKNVG